MSLLDVYDIEEIPENLKRYFIPAPQIGLEPTLKEYLDKLLQITAELQRVLKPTGVIFWNHGDSYDESKCVVMQNERLIIKMIDDQGWILRNRIIWNKPNGMPSSATDRFTNKYEPVYMLTKNQRYWFDLDVVREPYTEPLNRWGGNTKKLTDHLKKDSPHAHAHIERDMRPNPMGKNPGDVWTIPTQPYPEAHFATFPEKLIKPMILAGCPEEICKNCGMARVRITEPTEEYKKLLGKSWHPHLDDEVRGQSIFGLGHMKGATADYQTVGWTDCGCNAGWRSGIVLDPFMGSGTTALIALKNNHHFIGIELNPEYIKLAMKRLDPYLHQKKLVDY